MLKARSARSNSAVQATNEELIELGSPAIGQYLHYSIYAVDAVAICTPEVTPARALDTGARDLNLPIGPNGYGQNRPRPPRHSVHLESSRLADEMRAQ